MLRFLNIVAIIVLVGSAVYAYSIKYQTSYRAEQIAKTKIEIRQERDAIAVLRAEWAYMTRPERIQQLADAYLPGMKQIDALQIVAAQALPERSPRVDSIGQKLDSLGLSMPATPPVASSASTTTPKTQGQSQERHKP
jgi:cell division protein FtsL